MTNAVATRPQTFDHLTEYKRDTQGQPYMTSMEIAKLAGKPHRTVMREITAMLIDHYGPEALNAFQGEPFVERAHGAVYPCYELPKREVMALSSGFSFMQMRTILKRWEEIEAEADAEDQAT